MGKVGNTIIKSTPPKAPSNLPKAPLPKAPANFVQKADALKTANAFAHNFGGDMMQKI